MIEDLQKLINACKQELHDRQYTIPHTKLLMKEWGSFSRWCDENKVEHFSVAVAFQYCDESIGGHILNDGMTDKQKDRLRAIRMLASYWECGDFEFRSPRVERIFEGHTGQIIMDFLESERARGLTERTLEERKLYLYPFNCYLIQNNIDFDELNIEIIEEFFKFRNYELSSRHNCANHLRQFFRYLYENHLTNSNKALFVLKDNYRKGCKLPTTYTEEEISRVLASVDRASAMGKRDYLILLLAAEYGWRSGDIINFKFSQIDWDNNIISFNQHKTDVPVNYPLISSIGNAIIDYLKYGRPRSDSPEIIVSALRGEPLSAPTVHSIVSRYLRQANIENWKEKRHGAHSLRHSLASNLLKKNVSMPVISTILGHQKTETTKIYLKVDIEKLRLCPLPMPVILSEVYKGVKQK